MQVLLAILVLLAPIWVPMTLMAFYAFVVRGYLPKSVLSVSDKIYWGVYFVGWLMAGIGFVWQIFSWQISPMYHWLWLAVLGVPMLVAMVGVLYLSVMATDAWGVDR